MPDGNRSKRNARIQDILGALIKCRKSGTLKTERLVTILEKIDSRWGITPQQIGNICRQREDLRKGGVNEWVIVEGTS
jgi:hypothetical protein